LPHRARQDAPVVGTRPGDVDKVQQGQRSRRPLGNA
jgi:hypothetical protein